MTFAASRDIYIPVGIYCKYPRGYVSQKDKMTHTVADKQKLLNRVRRLKGQVEAVERALEADAGCTEVMRLLTAGRGAINGIMAEVVEDHIQMHMIDEKRKPSSREVEAASELVDVLRSYMG
jgi:DNA-binding FrmR family transcriptional regulator